MGVIVPLIDELNSLFVCEYAVVWSILFEIWFVVLWARFVVDALRLCVDGVIFIYRMVAARFTAGMKLR